MTKQILFDKFTFPLLAAFIGFLYLANKGDWQFAFIFSASMLFFLVLITFFKTDLYISNYICENGVHKFEYQRNFFKNKVLTLAIDSKSIDSYKFSFSYNSSSNSNRNTFNSIYLKYTDHEGDIDDKTFKFNNKDVFLKLVNELHNKKNEISTE
ncbi:hypothetical protein HNV10_11335 [Winogradskyella litoriviva]|uniref:PH domain-containing protein n=1 Tax=Winogradskyella litoriviva TaxID=1220182 RepID=A0ABX2E7T3_9FLAO|nr:hypothetical protein [Winogradskyella litoriviva]NRD23839.1 hypothetical protein [Winogradskyella litoriviva]